MGRHSKIVLMENGQDRRSIGYYSTPTFIADYIANRLLAINPNGNSVFDPCIGCGEMTMPFYRQGIHVSGMDIFAYDDLQVNDFVESDFLEFYRANSLDTLFSASTKITSDFIVANPPYNCHESEYIRSNRQQLKFLFGNIGIANMYSMFITAIIKIAKPGAVIGIITLDSFLTSRIHKPLRELILQECAIHDLVLCPMDLFRSQKADVRTCILILQKNTPQPYHVNVLNRPDNSTTLAGVLTGGHLKKQPFSNLVLDGKHDRLDFVVDVPADILDMFSWRRISDKFRCATGISTGNDKEFLRQEKIETFEVPFCKNPGNRIFYTEPDGYLINNYIDISKTTPNFMVRNKDIITEEGIACSSMGVHFGAVYRPTGMTFGVNPNIVECGDDIWWLLSYLNSSLVSYFVRGVLIRTNMITSGYVERIPLPLLDNRTKKILGKLSRNVVDNKTPREHHFSTVFDIDKILADSMSLNDSLVCFLQDFRKNILYRT